MKPSDNDKVLGIVGLGYVGLPLAVEFGKTRTVIAFDISETRISELRSGFDRTHECTNEQLTSATYVTFSSDSNDLGKCAIDNKTQPTERQVSITGCNPPGSITLSRNATH